MAQSKNSSESFPELRIKYCVDDGVETGVDVAQQGGRLEGHVTRRRVQGVLYTESVQNVTGEEWNPANKECGYKTKSSVEFVKCINNLSTQYNCQSLSCLSFFFL